MRFILAAAAAMLAAAPAAAQDLPPPPVPPEAEIADRLGDPALQHGIASTTTALLSALLDMRVGAFAQFTDPEEDIRADDTLRDLATRDDPYLEERAYADARRSTAMMGAMAGSLAAMMPELRAGADRLRGAMADIDRRYDDRDGYDDPGYDYAD